MNQRLKLNFIFYDNKTVEGAMIRVEKNKEK